MHLKSVETTPNPNSMKLNLDGNVGAAVTYTSTDKSACPKFISDLLGITGIQSVFACQDFLTLNKDPRCNWQNILREAKAIMSGESTSEPAGNNRQEHAEPLGQVQLLVQTFRGIPIQIKAVDPTGETRSSMGERFNEAAQYIQCQLSSDYLKERHWADHGIRYGTREEVVEQLKDELNGIFDAARLEQTKTEAVRNVEATAVDLQQIAQWLKNEDWHKRFAAVQELSRLSDEISLLEEALRDDHPQVRRLAAAALGATGNTDAVAALGNVVLNDDSAGVRRTAGDALSDIGDVKAEPIMCQALADPNKLVRWRAARFLADVGTTSAIPFLEKACEDTEFEVKLEALSALERIRAGAEGAGPAWKRIAEQQ